MSTVDERPPLMLGEGTRQCAHVARGELEQWATLIFTFPTPANQAIDATLSDTPTWHVCVMCAGRARGALFAAEVERPWNPDEVRALSGKVAEVLHTAGLEPSHSLALALLGLGQRMASELGVRSRQPKEGPTP